MLDFSKNLKYWYYILNFHILYFVFFMFYICCIFYILCMFCIFCIYKAIDRTRPKLARSQNLRAADMLRSGAPLPTQSWLNVIFGCAQSRLCAILVAHQSCVSRRQNESMNVHGPCTGRVTIA